MFASYSHYPIKTICIIRSSSHLFPQVVRELRAAFPAAHVTALVTKGAVLGAFAADVDEIIETPSAGGFKWCDIGPLRRRWQGRTCDLAVVLYNDVKGLRYVNVDMLALAALRPAHAVSVGIAKSVTPLGAIDVIQKLAHCLGGIVWAGINLLMGGIVAVVIVLVMMVTAPIIMARKLHFLVDETRNCR